MRTRSGSNAHELANLPEQMIGLVPIVDIAAGGIVHACDAVMTGTSQGDTRQSPDNAAYLKAAMTFARVVGLDSLLVVKFDVTAMNEPGRLLGEMSEFAQDLQWPIDRLVLEVSGIPHGDAACFEKAVAAARSRGVAVALGGFSLDETSFSRLIDWRPDYIKLRSDFVRSMDKDRLRQELTLGLSRACRTFGGRIIVSEVASARQCEAVVRLGAELIQGPIFTSFNPVDGSAVVSPDQLSARHQNRSIH